MNSVLETHSLKSLSVPLNIKNETKQKFEAILKAALNKKAKSATEKTKSISKEKLLDVKSSEDIFNKKPDNYILNKFLNTSNDIDEYISVDVETDGVTYIQPPIPKPRTKIKELQRTNSQSSHGTFIVTSPKMLASPNHSSNRTFVVDKEIGDILIHNAPKKIVVVSQNSSPVVEKGETEDLSDTVEIPFVKNSSEIEGINEIIELNEIKNDEVEIIDEVKPRPKKRLRKSKNTKTEIKEISDFDQIIEIIIHKCDRLKIDSLVVHPVVKIHIVDSATGKYFKKSDKNRSVVFFYEDKQFDYILPVITQCYNLQEKRSLYPAWEETIFLNEDYNYFKENSPQIILFFEIVDFVSFSVAASATHHNDKGWHRVAFAFLKPSANEHFHLEKKLRLQLYNLPNIKNTDVHMCPIWSLWKNKKIVKYPSTLYVTIKSTISPGNVVDVLRSKQPFQGEKSKSKLHEDLIDIVDNKEVRDNQSNNVINKKPGKIWSKKPHENCKLPNKLATKFPTCNEGCFVFKFSCNGLHLACAIKNGEVYGIVIYSVRYFYEISRFLCHQGLIYSIRWSHDDALIISASADNTISIWNVETSSLSQILPHPSFVYCAIISSKNEIASGCFDRTVRIWSKSDDKFCLSQELQHHKGFITSICFNKKCNLMFSSDSVGVVIEWRMADKDWEMNREITLFDLKQTVINQIQLLYRERRILIHSRDSTIRIVDLKSTCILHWLLGGLNLKVQTLCTLSPCESRLLAGSENGSVHVWNVKSGHEYAIYNPFPLKNVVINCVEFHPLDNIVALSHYGSNLPILLYDYNNTAKGNELIDLKLLKNNAEDRKNIHQSSSSNVHDQTMKRRPKHENENKNIDFKKILRKMDDVIESQTDKKDVNYK